MTKPKRGKIKDTRVVIYDVAKGNWEVNELVYPLYHDYTQGLTSITSLNKDGEVILSAPVWYWYILFGLKMLKRKLFHKL